MNKTPTVDSDLQKAIDDITKTTDEAIDGITNTTNTDPVFADPVAAPSSIPEGDTGELAESVGPFPAPEPIVPPISEVPEVPEVPEMPKPVISETVVTEEVSAPAELNVQEVKIAALRDLAPLIGKMDIPAAQKFHLCREIFENLRDYTVINAAYQAAKNIPDERERGEALLYLINSINKM